MVNHPQLAVVSHADDDLVELLVVVDCVGVGPVGSLPSQPDVVNVDQLRMVCNDAEVARGEVAVLNQMVPDVPFPDNVSSYRSGWLNLDDVQWRELAI